MIPKTLYPTYTTLTMVRWSCRLHESCSLNSQRPLSSLLLTGTSHHYLRLASTSLIDNRYHVVAPALNHMIDVVVNSALINGLGRYPGGPMTDLAVVNVECGKRYRLRLIAMSCHANFVFSIDH